MPKEKDPESPVVISFRAPEMLRAELDVFAATYGIDRSEAARQLLEKALTSGSAIKKSAVKDLTDKGYQDGLRRGLAEARAAIQSAMAKVWKK